MTHSTHPKFNTIGLSSAAAVAVCLASAPLAADARAHSAGQAKLAGFDGNISELSGIWSPDCSDPDEYFTLFNQTHVMTVSGYDSVASYAALENSWVNDDSIQLAVSNNTLNWTLGTGEDADAYEDQRCSSLPATLSMLHGEAVAFFQNADDLAHACGASGQACIDTLFKQHDIAGTGGINEADLSRLIRIGSYYATMDDTGQAEFSDLAIAQAAAVGLAPLAANLLIRSFDYDADGQVSVTEVTTNREFLNADNLPSTSGAASELEENLRQSVQQLQQLLLLMQ